VEKMKRLKTEAEKMNSFNKRELKILFLWADTFFSENWLNTQDEFDLHAKLEEMMKDES
jgi:hypothetical protein